ncbi:hypothetical protein [Nocardioides hwasunensis]|uniref:Secreted protein n=1 Tax=Nocardioides hwasunensis TaxID=397258 RepID=A0ABR8MBN4_9ACTN|nr:hypothetical protein [Nocardioides hwasunensis]MBD3913557.1 hypothetical protein [Nocardioides hwasunensis]
MTTEQVWLVAAGAVALTALVLALLARRRARRAEGLLETLVARVALLESPATDVPVPLADTGATTYVITGVGDGAAATTAPTDPPDPEVPLARPIDGRLFADIVARESVVKAASWTHGLRRALSPESRNRIRFHVRQETKQAGRERRAEMKQALREFRARERAAARRDVDGDLREDVA